MTVTVILTDVAEEDRFAGFDEKLQLALAGKLEHEKSTAPVNPLLPLTVKPAEEDPEEDIESGEGEMAPTLSCTTCKVNVPDVCVTCDGSVPAAFTAN
jgi:hypothetical protein